MPWALNIGTDVKDHDRRYWVVAGVTIALGIALRLWGYFEYEFWQDESIWAGRILRSLASPSRPIGYMYVSQLLARLHNTEPVLRLPSLLASIATLPLLLVLCRKARLSWPVSLFGLFVLAIHPWAVTSSKEFKPYALELALHLLLMVLAVNYLSSKRTRDLLVFAVLAVASPAFAWTVAMLLPWLLFWMLALALRERRKAQASIVFASGTLTMLVMAAIFLTRLEGAKRRDSGYWGNRYDVFFVGDGAFEHVRWLLEKTAELAAFPAQLWLFWGPGAVAQAIFNWLFVGAVVAGCVYLVRTRSWFFLVAWLAPWLTAIVLGAAQVWPYGVFRTNLFMLGYSLLLALCGMQYLWEAACAHAVGKKLLLAAAVAFVLLTFPYRFSEAAQKVGAGHTASVRRGLEIIKEYEEAAGRRPGKRFRLLLDNHSCPAFKYYTKDHAVASEALRGFFSKNAKQECLGKLRTLERRIRSRKGGGQFWLLAARGKLFGALEASVAERCNPDVLVHLPGPTLLAHCPGSK